MNKQEILNNFYNFMRKYNFVYLSLSYLKFDGVNRVFNENLNNWINLTEEEVNTFTNLNNGFVTIEDFHNFYFKKVKENKISNRKLVDGN